MGVENPGSFSEWAERHPEQNHEEQIHSYSTALEEHREHLAEEQRISLDELHERRKDTAQIVGQMSLLNELERI